MIAHCGFDLHFPMVSDIEHLSMYLLTICVFFGKMSVVFCNFFFLLLSCMLYIYIYIYIGYY